MIKWIIDAFWAIFKIVSQYSKELAFIAVLLAYSVFVSNAIIEIYNIVHSFLNLASGGGNVSGDLSKFYGLLNCVGLVDAINATKFTLISAITFYFSKLAWDYGISLYELILKAMKRGSSL